MNTLLALACISILGQTPAGDALRAGDEVRLTIPGAPGGGKVVSIDERGVVDLESYGSVQLAGLVLEESREVLRRHLARWIRTIDAVDVVLVRRGSSVMVTGMVARPGMLVLREPEDLWQAIQRAGGVVPGADLSRVTLTHTSTRITVNLWAFLTQEGGGPLPLLRSGDTLFVPADPALPAIEKAGSPWATPQALERKVFVLGAVLRGGLFDAAPGLDVLTALALAGGPAPAADLTRVRVAHRGDVTTVDVTALLSGRASPQGLPTGGVMIYVPAGVAGEDDPLRSTVTVLGAVRGTGKVTLGRPLPLGDVLALAGGTSDKADLRRVRVTQHHKGLTISGQYDLTAQDPQSAAALIRVKAGDSVYVANELRAQDDVAPWVQVVSGIVLTVSSILVISGVR